MNRRLAAALLCGLLVGPLDAVAQARFDFDSAPGQLPKSVLPLHHALTLTVEPDAESFTCAATRTLLVREVVATDIAIAQIELRAAIRTREAARLPAVLSVRR